MSSSASPWVTFECSNPCRMEGCPGHKVRFVHHRTSDTYEFEFENEKDSLHFDEGRWHAMMQAYDML